LTLDAPDTELGQHVSDIVAAYVGNHQIEVLEIPVLIQSVYGTLAKLAARVARNVSTTLRQPVWEIRLGVEASGLAG
jgi:predicted transcriptional regulator